MFQYCINPAISRQRFITLISFFGQRNIGGSGARYDIISKTFTLIIEWYSWNWKEKSLSSHFLHVFFVMKYCKTPSVCECRSLCAFLLIYLLTSVSWKWKSLCCQLNLNGLWRIFGETYITWFCTFMSLLFKMSSIKQTSQFNAAQT